MMKEIKPGIVSTLLIAAFSTAALGAAVFQVAWKGALRDTHRGSHAHLHVVLANGESGHVDELRVGPDVQLLLPRT